MTEKEQNYLSAFEYSKNIGYAQYLDLKPTQVHMLRDAREDALEKITQNKAVRDKIRKSINHFLNSETRLYNCGGLPVELNLPEGEHKRETQVYLFHIFKTGERLSDLGVYCLFGNWCNRLENTLWDMKL